MKIHNLNQDSILHILIFLDLESIHQIKLVNSKFYSYFKLAFNKLSFVGILIQNKNNRELKKSQIVNPNYNTLKVICNFKDAKKIFKNYNYHKKKLEINF